MRKQSEPFVCLDGTLIRTDRVAVRDPDTGHLWYSGKHTEFGANIQVLADHTGYPVWISPLEPGLTHDITAARRHVLPALYPGRSPGAAHPGRQELHRSRHQYQDPHQGRQTLPRHVAYNTIQAGLHTPDERTNALLKGFKAHKESQPGPSAITTIASTALIILNLNNQPQ